ncbi:SGNH/GDSL hydrolase family protein [Massilia sp. BHUDP2]|uniref:SGNH/GDSL hydrolase family protein n=1 Tax=Massilia sp. BHUDP2 TaxID=3034505 RepID=UPI00390629CF
MIGPILGGVPKIRYTSDATNVVFDGNSLVFGQGSSGGQSMPAQLAALAPIGGRLSITNLGISGQNLGQMRSNASDVDGAWVDGKRNVLLVWEGTNALNYGGTVNNAYNDTAAYCAERLALHPWLIVLLTTIPRQNQGATQADTDAYNAKLTDYNTRIKSGYKAMGAKAVIDVRQEGSPFAFANYLPATFDAPGVGSLWASEGAMRVHLNNAGYGVVAQMVADGLKRLPAR